MPINYELEYTKLLQENDELKRQLAELWRLVARINRQQTQENSDE